MKILTFVTTVFLLPLASFAAQAELMLAPRINTPEAASASLYSEETGHWYGTTAYLLKSDLLAQRTAKRFKTVSTVTVEAKWAPDTSVLQVTVTGASEPQNREYLDALLEEWTKYREELVQETYKKHIQSLQTAIDRAKEPEAQASLQRLLRAAQTARLVDNGIPFIRIK